MGFNGQDFLRYHGPGGSHIDLRVGDRFKTPYGIAEVTALNDERREIRSTKGSWGYEEIYLTLPPEPDEGRKALVDFLLGPRLEVRTTHGTVYVNCLCGCGCKKMTMTNRGTTAVVFSEHLAGWVCDCQQKGCHCLPSA